MKKTKKKLKKKFVFILTVIILIITVLLGTLVYYLLPVSSNKEEKIVEIANGNGLYDIANILEDENIIKNAKIFVIYMKLNNVKNIYAATYKLSPNMTMKQILDVLESGGINSNQISITFNEGINMRKIADIISSNLDIDYDEVLEKSNDKQYLKTLIDKYWFLTDDILNDNIYYSLEGYLYPDTYFFNKDAKIEDIFDAMLEKEEEVLNKYKKDIEKNSYSIHELITLSSITQSEGYNEKDFSNIASVFFNRLSAGMSLGSCVTSYYGVKKDMTDELFQPDIDDVNPYNTRSGELLGLPVGPVSMPGEEAIKAVVYPKNTKYYYFVSDINNNLYFTTNEAEHEKMIKELQDEGLWLEW